MEYSVSSVAAIIKAQSQIDRMQLSSIIYMSALSGHILFYCFLMLNSLFPVPCSLLNVEC